MSEKIEKNDFELELDAETSKKFLRFLEDEGLMQATFEARESGASGSVSLKVVVTGNPKPGAP